MVNEGKPLIGVSAGSIIMSKSIKIAAFHDENEVQLNELSGLGLVDFEFMPHWNREKDQLDELLKYSLIQEESIFTCDDGDGIVIEGDEIEFYGDINAIHNAALLLTQKNKSSIGQTEGETHEKSPIEKLYRPNGRRHA